MKEGLSNLLLVLKNFWCKLTLPSKIIFIIWTLASISQLFSNQGNLNFLQRLLTTLFGYLFLVGITQLISKRKKSPDQSNGLSKKKRSATPYKRTLAPTDDLPIEFAPNIVLSNGEICHYCGMASHVKAKNVVVGYSGGSRGTSIRVAKGVSFRVGASSSSPVREDVQEISNGVLSITNKRIIFSGIKKSFDHKITSLSAVTPGKDGIVLQFGSTYYPLMTDEPIYIYQILSRIVNLPTDIQY